MSDNGARLACLQRLLEEGGGQVRFDRWMEAALFDPVVGYYSTGIGAIGRDFTTWPELDASLGQAVAAWWRSVRAGTGNSLVEVGAGNGQLAKSVLRACPWWRRPSLRVVDVSPVLVEKQKALLGRRVRWFGNVADACEQGRGAVYANELIDAFPCRVFRLQAAEEWRELWLRPAGSQIEEVWDVPEALPSSSAFDSGLPVGSRVEVHESFHRWLQGLAGHLRGARFLFIDYGTEAPQVYRRSPGGTLRAYHRHQRLYPPEAYLGFGRRDLTADVNFTDIARVAKSLGWTVVRSCALEAFLQEFSSRPAGLLQLRGPGGAGEAFYVLELEVA